MESTETEYTPGNLPVELNDLKEPESFLEDLINQTGKVDAPHADLTSVASDLQMDVDSGPALDGMVDTNSKEEISTDIVGTTVVENIILATQGVDSTKSTKSASSEVAKLSVPNTETVKIKASQSESEQSFEMQSISGKSRNIIAEAAAESVIDSFKWKPTIGSFSLGIPDLTFSAQNLKVAKDGTKMVQIHQSQLTQSQFQALQSNPNIKLVFRHIPTRRSCTKPPKNLFNSNRSRQKRNSDFGDSIYNFDEESEDDWRLQDQQGVKAFHSENGYAKSARYNSYPYALMKKRGPGRPRIFPSVNLSSTPGYKPALPAQIQLTDALVKLNKAGATHTVKVHVKQVTHNILISMELNPDYNIALTTKYEPRTEHIKEKLVEKREEKEAASGTNELENVQLEEEKENKTQKTGKSKERLQELPKTQKSNDEKEVARQLQKLREEQKEKEEAELLSKVLGEKTSRCGRIRKPTRYSLEIARMTKRRPHIEDKNVSPNEEVIVRPTPLKRQLPKVVQAEENNCESPPKKKLRGRPRKFKQKGSEQLTAQVAGKDSSTNESNKTSHFQQSPHMSTEPRVMMSSADKRLAETIRMQSSEVIMETGGTKVKEELITEDVIEETLDEKETDDNYAGKKDESNERMEDTTETNSEIEGKKWEDETEKTCLNNGIPEPVNADNQLDTCIDSQVVPVTDSVTESQVVPVADSDIHQSKDQIAETVINEKADSKQENENPSDVLARKLDCCTFDKDKTPLPNDPAKTESESTTLKDFVEEEGNIDNKHRLRKLLQQCSVEEIRSVAIPRALNILSVGDFFLHKAGQMCKKKVNYPALFQQFENLHMEVQKEAKRYCTLLKRANKVGGDKRMDKVILMPVYNKQAADSLNVNNTSIDAHISGIYQRPTTHMIAANSFRMICKMDTPVHRLKIPELSDRIQGRKKRGGMPVLGNNLTRLPPGSQEVEKTANYISRTLTTASNSRSTWKRGYNFNKPTPQETLQHHARMQIANQYQIQPIAISEPVGITSTINNTAIANPILAASESVGIIGASDTSTTLATPVTSDLTTTQGSEIHTQVVPAAEDGTPLVAAEDGKQLVSIGDGQYVELPEGYTLIQTDEGYIIGQPGATFVQGEDGNLYMTSSEDQSVDVTNQVLTTTAAIGENPQPTDQLLQHLSQT